MFKHRRVLFVGMAALVFLVGTLVGRGQAPPTDFLVTVDVDGRTLTATCVRGCEFQRLTPIVVGERNLVDYVTTVTSPCPGGCKATLSGIVVPPRRSAH